MKLPNRYGSITKLSGKRRRPYIVRIWAGTVYDDKISGYKEKREILGYYATRKDALNALADYNATPFNLSDNNITFRQIFERLEKKETVSEKTLASRRAAYKYCEPIKDMKIKDIKTAALQEVIDQCPHGTSTKKNIRTVMRMVFEYALQNDLASKDYSEFIRIGISDPVIDRVPFTDEEIQKLWDLKERWDVQILLILLYTGMRVNELLLNTKENVDLENRSIYIPKELAKNQSSIRYVPIHDRILPLVSAFYNRSTGKLITNDNGFVVTYNNFCARNLKKINSTIGAVHRFHDTRHTFITKAHKYKLDELVLKKIVGHSPDSITQKVYTHITLDDMHLEIKKFK